MSTNRSVLKFARPLGRAGITLTAAGLIALLGAAPAAAHVHADSDDAVQGDYGKITFKVPNEKDNSGTIKVQISFPADHPVGGAKTKPVPGWTAKVSKKKLAKPIQEGENQLSEQVTTVTWTANPGTRINPGEFQEFDINAGPLPTDTKELALPAAQTYDDGEVVNWNQPTKEGQPEPERPAPTVELAASEGAAHSHGETASAGSGDAEHGSADETARWLGGAGLAVGALGLGAGAGAVLRVRKAGRRGAAE
jgi:uncharacterized protein YcnI